MFALSHRSFKRLTKFVGIGPKNNKKLYDLLYGLEWGDITTNNYGFAPTDGEHPERFQRQMYAELNKLLGSQMPREQIERALEISCGRGGGLAHLIDIWQNGVYAVGLDWSQNALQFCERQYGRSRNASFVRGTALELPFGSGSFDVAINVEASTCYGDDAAFFREVHRVLRPQGLFLFADTRSPTDLGQLDADLRQAGFRGSVKNITSNVLMACEEDSERRQKLIRSRIPWYYRMLIGSRLVHYAAIKGSKKFARLQDGRRVYFMACLTKCA